MLLSSMAIAALGIISRGFVAHGVVGISSLRPHMTGAYMNSTMSQRGIIQFTGNRLSFSAESSEVVFHSHRCQIFSCCLRISFIILSFP